MGLADATGPSCVGFLFSLDFLMQHQSSGSLGSCPPIWWVTDGWSAVTTGICGLRESPFPVAELGLFHLVDCMQHEMAAHMLEVCRLLYTSCLALSLGQSKLLGLWKIKGRKGLLFVAGALYCSGMNPRGDETSSFSILEGMLLGSVCVDNRRCCEFLSSAA